MGSDLTTKLQGPLIGPIQPGSNDVYQGKRVINPEVQCALDLYPGEMILNHLDRQITPPEAFRIKERFLHHLSRDKWYQDNLYSLVAFSIDDSHDPLFSQKIDDSMNNSALLRMRVDLARSAYSAWENPKLGIFHVSRYKMLAKQLNRL